MARPPANQPSRQPAPPRVVFVCTGNTCRSPMAELLLREHVRQGLACDVSSAGIAATSGSPASPEGIAALREWGLDLATHRSQPLTRAMVRQADLLVPLSMTHFAAILERHPEARKKTLLLGSFLEPDHCEPRDIADPIGGTLAEYRSTRDQIAKAVDALARFLENW